MKELLNGIITFIADITITNVSHMQGLVVRDYIVSKLKGDIK